MKKSLPRRTAITLLAILLCAAQLSPAQGAFTPGSVVSINQVSSIFGWGENDLFSTVYTGKLDPKRQYSFKLRPDGMPGVNQEGRQLLLKQEVTAAWHEESKMPCFLIYDSNGSQFGQVLENGLLITQEDSFSPAWMAEKKGVLADVTGTAVQSAMPDGYYVTSSIRTGNFGLYRFDSNWGNQSLIWDLKRYTRAPFCIVDGTIYLSTGFLQPDGSFSKYGDERFAIYDYELIGTDGRHLVFRTQEHSTMLLRTNLRGEQGLELWNTKAAQDIVFRYCSVSNGMLLCSYKRHSQFTNQSNQLANRAEYDVKLFDLASGAEIPLHLPVGAEENSSGLQLLSKAYWARLHEKQILLVDSPALKQLSVYSLESGKLRPLITSDDMLLSNISKGESPVCAAIDGWLYHLYAYDNTMLLRTALDGSVTSQFVATLDQPIKQIDAANGRIIVLSGTGGNRKYTDFTP